MYDAKPDENFPGPAEIDRQMSDLGRRLRVDPDAGRLWEQLGILQFDRNQRAALASLETASLLVPLTQQGQMTLADCYATAGYPQTARAIYRHLAATNDLATEMLPDLATGLERVGLCELALAVCRDAARRMPGSVVPLLGIARCLRRLRRPAATVLPYLTRAMALDPANTECRISLAWTLHACGRSGEGAEMLDGIHVATVECVPSLTRMHRVFEAADEQQGAKACKYRLEALAAQRWRHRP